MENLIALVSSKFRNSKQTALISSMIASTASSNIFLLQVALGLLVQENLLIEYLYEYGVTASYDEVRRFKTSAAAASKNKNKSKIKQNGGLMQGVSDNFDANLCTQNGIKQTHSLASIVTKYDAPNIKARKPIPRLRKTELSTVKFQDIQTKVYTGEKKPSMLKTHSTVGVLPSKVLSQQEMILAKIKEDDFCFIKSSLTEKKCSGL